MTNALGLPVVSHYDDFGAYFPDSVSKEEIATLRSPIPILVVKMGASKYKAVESVGFLDPGGRFPTSDRGCI